MINKKFTVCALALGFLALSACSPSGGQTSSSSKAPESSQAQSSTTTESKQDSSSKDAEKIAGKFVFNVPNTYGNAYMYGTDGTIFGDWPGKALTASTEEGWNTIEVTVTDAANDTIIFNGTEGQTANLPFPGSIGTWYFVENGEKDESGYAKGDFVKNVFKIDGKAKAMVGKTGALTLTSIGVSGKVTWSSKDTTIAVVTADSANDKAATWTAVADGKTEIIAKAGDVEAKFTVTVEEAESETDLTLWVPTTDTDFITNTVISGYKKAHPEFNGKITVKANLGEGDVRTELAKDLDTAADIMCIADDNIRSAANSKLLASLTDSEESAIKTSDGENAVTAGSLDGTLYGYPYRGDNGYILFYNKAIFTNPETVESMDDLLSVAKEKNVKVYWDMANGWYSPAPFWANGVDFHLDADGNIVSTFDSDEAVKTGMALMKQYKTYGGTTLVYSSDNGQIESGFKDGTVGACILWNDYQTLKAQIGDNLGYTVLPSMTIDGSEKALHTFNGYKFMSVKAGLSSAKTELAKSFCEYATSAEVQLERAKKLGHGPSNLKVADNADVKALPFVGQIAEMMAAGHTHAQAPNVNDNFWTPMGSIGATISQGAATDTWGTFGSGEAGAKKFFASIKENIEKKIA